jgi:hypothetical protein
MVGLSVRQSERSCWPSTAWSLVWILVLEGDPTGAIGTLLSHPEIGISTFLSENAPDSTASHVRTEWKCEKFVDTQGKGSHNMSFVDSQPVFRTKILHPSSGLKLSQAKKYCEEETLVAFGRTIRCHVSKHNTAHNHSCGEFKSNNEHIIRRKAASGKAT